MIMDCCMNLPLLYWASEETGNQKYKKAAQAHIQNAADYLVREDGSTYHTFYMDVKDGKPRYGSTHQGYSDNSMNRLPEDTICYWDLIFDDSSREEKDTSSMVIMVCGLLELIESGLLDKTEKNLYQSAVWKIMRQLKERYATTEEEDGFLTQSVYNKPKNNGVNTPCIWGDYYYLEALVRMTSNWSSYW